MGQMAGATENRVTEVVPHLSMTNERYFQCSSMDGAAGADMKKVQIGDLISKTQV